MSSNIKKLIGWLLLIAGLVIIVWALYSSYNIFSAKEEPPEIFKTEKSDLPEQKTTELEEQMKEMMEEQLEGLLPKNFSSQLFNLIAWSIFAGILIFGGGKISAIGIKLIGKK